MATAVINKVATQCSARSYVCTLKDGYVDRQILVDTVYGRVCKEFRYLTMLRRSEQTKQSSQDAELAVHAPRQRSFFEGAANKEETWLPALKTQPSLSESNLELFSLNS